jgi:hypothetical protein
MANVSAIRTVGTSLIDYLTNEYAAATFPNGITKPSCTFEMRPIGGLKTADVAASDTGVTVLVFLYRASMNQHLRNVWRPNDPGMRPVPLSVDLHYLFTFWSGTKGSENEHLALAWTMRQLHETPMLDSSMLGAEADWASDDLIQLIPEEISTEDLMRIWDTLEPNYRLSLSYIARVVRINPDALEEERPVVATRMDFAVPLPTP